MNWNAKETSVVAINSIWGEHVEKEKKFMNSKTKFTCNPQGMKFVTDKVGTRVGLDPVEVGDDPDVRAVVQGLLDAHKVPREKYEEPTTSAQEVGWHTNPLVPVNPRNQHGLAQGDATKFAENYTQKMAGAHMFHGKSGKYLRF